VQGIATIAHSLVEAQYQRLFHEAKGVEEVALARAVRADQDRERLQLYVAVDDAFVVLQDHPGDPGGRLGSHAQVYDVAMRAEKLHGPTTRPVTRIEAVEAFVIVGDEDDAGGASLRPRRRPR
jgi:hypothetical protein